MGGKDGFSVHHPLLIEQVEGMTFLNCSLCVLNLNSSAVQKGKRKDPVLTPPFSPLRLGLATLVKGGELGHLRNGSSRVHEEARWD